MFSFFQNLILNNMNDSNNIELNNDELNSNVLNNDELNNDKLNNIELNNDELDKHLYSNENKLECCVCFNLINTDLSLKWQCNHNNICNLCSNKILNSINNKCPICRSFIRKNEILCNTPIDYIKYKNVLDINIISNLPNIPNNLNLYKNKWIRQECINSNHNLIIRQTYGVIIICADCNIIKSYNLIN